MLLAVVRARQRLQIQPHDRLRVRRPDIEPPRPHIEPQAVDPQNIDRLFAVGFFQTLHHCRRVVNLEVDLARLPVPAHAFSQFAEFLAGRGQHSQREHQRDRARIAVIILAEIIMAAQFAGEHRVRLAHRLFNVRMPYSAEFPRAAVLFNHFADRNARPQIE